MNSAPPNWHPDPYGRFQLRYFDGTNWTAHVVDTAGNQSTDAAPLGAPRGGQQPQQAPQGQWGGQQLGQPQQQQQPGAWGQTQQQPPAQQFQSPGQQFQQPPQQPYGQPPAQPYGQQPPTGQGSSPVTKNFVGTIVAGVGAVVMFIGCFALDWLTVSVEGFSEEFSRGDISDLMDATGADVAFVPDSFFSWGWIIAVIAAVAAVAVALVKLPPLRIAGAVLAAISAIWAFAATADIQESGMSLGIGMWLTVLGLVAGAVGAVIALIQDRSST